MKLTPDLAAEYLRDWDRALILLDWQGRVLDICTRILNHRERYQSVATLFNAKGGSLPWQVVAAIHSMECSLSFNHWLFNGDPMPDKTTHVPKGYPKGKGPWTWETGAVQALELDGARNVVSWSIAATCHFLEGFNGWGYRRHPGHKSAYLWSATSIATPGKFVRDGVWDDDAISGQVGCVAILKGLGFH